MCGCVGRERESEERVKLFVATYTFTAVHGVIA